MALGSPLKAGGRCAGKGLKKKPRSRVFKGFRMPLHPDQERALRILQGLDHAVGRKRRFPQAGTDCSGGLVVEAVHRQAAFPNDGGEPRAG